MHGPRVLQARDCVPSEPVSARLGRYMGPDLVHAGCSSKGRYASVVAVGRRTSQDAWPVAADGLEMRSAA